MLAEDLWRLFDIIGTLAFAVSGTLVGISRRMDIFGISVLALATAVGGGMVRDMLVGITPPMALRNTTNFLLSVGVALLTSLLYQRTALHHMRRRRLLTMFNVSDTIGLAAFTITGALTGVRFGGDDSYVLPVLLAATTAVGGGMIRDVLAQRMPVVLYAEVYAAASPAGGGLKAARHRVVMPPVPPPCGVSQDARVPYGPGVLLFIGRRAPGMGRSSRRAGVSPVSASSSAGFVTVYQ